MAVSCLACGAIGFLIGRQLKPIAVVEAKVPPEVKPTPIYVTLPEIKQVINELKKQEAIADVYFGDHFTVGANAVVSQDYDKDFFEGFTPPFEIVTVALALNAYNVGDRVNIFWRGERVVKEVPFPMDTLNLPIRRLFETETEKIRVQIRNVAAADKICFLVFGARR